LSGETSQWARSSRVARLSPVSIFHPRSVLPLPARQQPPDARRGRDGDQAGGDVLGIGIACGGQLLNLVALWLEAG
jgi:hypothetical protein